MAKTKTKQTPAAPDVEGFDVPLSTVLALVARHRAGESLTFQDGLTVAYAISERLQDDLQYAAAGFGDEQIGAVADELVTLTSRVYSCSSVRDQVREATKATPKAGA